MNESRISNALERLADEAGVLTSYTNLSGEVCYASPDSLMAALRSLGVHIDDPNHAEELLAERTGQSSPNVHSSVIVAWDGHCPSLGAGNIRITPEQGGASIDLNQPLPIGYFNLEQTQDGTTTISLVISAPSKCYQKSPTVQRLGIFAPFYALRSNSSWGVGDFGDARELIRWAVKRGVDVVGTLPLSAQFLADPCDPSPYQPLSRLFWNELYIDLRRLPEYRSSSRVHRLVATSAIEKERKTLADFIYVDYRRTAALKRQILELLSEEVCSDAESPRNAEMRLFVEANPDLIEYARFRSVSEAKNDFPPERLIEYFIYTQWIVATQLTELVTESESLGVGLYLDLPLGSHSQGYDLWKYKDIFVSGMSIGAPPDPLGPEGQVWGIPPINPIVSRRTGHAYLREVIRRHTSIASLLRIDHVTGLHRLFWVPDGMPASEGVYVKYPAEELWAILSLESHLNRCEIVGEDLGTVPDEVREEMNRRAALRLYVLPFEADSQSDPEIKPPPVNSIASLNTHDLVPFAGYWQESDINERSEWGWLDERQEGLSRQERGRFRAAVRKEALAKNVWPEGGEDTKTAIRAAHNLLAASDSSVVLLNIEDLWAETESQNRPGTVDPIPNWRKKFTKSLDEIITDITIADQIKELVGKRGRAITMAGRKKNEVASGATPIIKSSEEVIGTTVGSSQSYFRLTKDDCYLFNEGSHLNLYEKLGSHLGEVDGVAGTHFAVWAPDAESVHLIGDFNGWNRTTHPLFTNDSSGIWEAFIPGITATTTYKYFVKSRFNGFQVEKADPFAFHAETSPKTGSKVWNTDYKWSDSTWMEGRGAKNRLDAPMSIYEMHLGSWRRVVEQGERSLSYRELAEQLPSYLIDLGFTHVQFLPVMEHPFYGSWGYQTTGYFAPTSRYGTPQDLMHLIDVLHQNNIAVILDWVPSHFPSDEHGLAYFDGTHLYEHADSRQGFHPDWGSLIFNYGRNEVRSFLFSSGLFWLDKFHADGLRVDAVASMLYLDYSRKAGEWITNHYGGRENLDAISFLRRFNEEVYSRYPDVQIMAEESTSWPAVSRPTYLGGLGFGYKWDMGWMHDILDYFSRDPIHRKYYHNSLTFRMLYAWHENFVLPLSHDEVVHGKGSLIGKMPGDAWQKFANLRLLMTVQFTQPGKKLLFMGGEIGQWSEWNHDRSLDWHLLDYPNHSGLKQLVTSLNEIYRRESALYELDCDVAGFEWLDCNDAEGSSLSYLRWNRDRSECVLVVLNFTPETRFDYRLGVPWGGTWKELFNSDSEHYAGSGKGNFGQVYSTGEGFHGRPDSVLITLPPLGAVILKRE